jgi:antitoxin component YwqK of YwqJK toxin-antitoxin module
VIQVVEASAEDLEYDDEYYAYLNGSLFTGRAFDYWPDGCLRAQVDYLNGVQHGWSCSWHRNGQRRLEVHYEKGQAKGELTSWFETGQIQSYKVISEHGEVLIKREWSEAGVLLEDRNDGPKLFTV